jgi:putative endonuclease
VTDQAPPGPDRRALGREGEALAEAFLVGQGYQVLARNHVTRRGEVDLICREGEVICFVEVRSRGDERHGSPLETIGADKARRVVAAATDWAWRNGRLEAALRFDVVAVVRAADEAGEPQITLIRDAFDATGRPVP